MAEEEVAVVAGSVSPVPSDHKRKLEDLEPQEAEEEPEEEEPEELSPGSDGEAKSKEDEDAVPDAKRPRLEDGSDSAAVENGHEEKKEEVAQVENVEQPTEGTNLESAEGASVENNEIKNVDDSSMEDLKEENPQQVNLEQPTNENSQTAEALQTSAEGSQQATEGVPEQGDLPPADQEPSEAEEESMSRKMEVPNNKVGVLIGKAGDTIRFLQFNSGAKIQITRDAEADPSSSTRPVELIGSLENINKAEKLIRDVIAEADAGGSPSLVARGFGTIQATGAAEQIQIHVPNEKVGLIIGKGGDTIKNLQTRSGARIQLIPQHAPEGDQSKDRLVRVSGDKKQIEIATEMIKEVMSQPVRQSPLSGGYNQQQQNYRPRGSAGPGQWGPRGPSSGQGTGYDYQRGMYQSQNQYSQSYGGYPPQHSAPRSNFHGGWDQRSSGHMHGPPSQSSGYDYYGQGGHGSDGPAPGPISNAGPHGSAPSSQVNYNYGQPQGMDYGQPNAYSQTGHSHSYGHGYEDPKYPHQGPTQPSYGGRGSSQPGAYPQQANHPGYPQQPYNKPAAYNMPAQGPPQAYGMPRTSGQHGEMPYQGPNPTNPPYGANVPAQQGYPYSTSGPAQQNYPYGSAPVAGDGYNQAPPHGTSTPGYPQQGAQPVPGYGQPGVQPTPNYGQGAGQAGYGSYPTQPGYGEPVANNANYGGYQGTADAGYNSGAPAAAYGAPPGGQAGYVQPTPNQHGYEQPIAQAAAYGNVPGGTAPAGYAKNVSPQPAAYNQYDATQMYGAQH